MVKDAIKKVANDGPRPQIQTFSKSIFYPTRLMYAPAGSRSLVDPGDLGKAASDLSKLYRLTLISPELGPMIAFSG